MTTPHSVLVKNHPKLTLMHSGSQYFANLIEQIDKADHEVLLETYIFHHDDDTDKIQTSLMSAAKRGVRVYLLTDWIGTPVLFNENQLVASGVEHRVYNPHYWSIRFGYSRTHRKIAVIDQKVAFVGGINLISDWISEDQRPLQRPRWDKAVRIDDDLFAYKIRCAFFDIWQKLDVNYLIGTAQTQKIFNRSLRKRHHHKLITFLERDNLFNRRTIEKAYRQAIGQAKSEVLLANPYFIPSRKLRNALISASLRGVKVTLLLGQNQYPFLDMAVTHLYQTLSKAGIAIYHYTQSELHGKVAVIDYTWFTVGSSNCDALSLFLNHEANIAGRDTSIAIPLRKDILSALSNAERLTDDMVKNIIALTRIRNWFIYVIYRLFMKIIVHNRVDE